MIKGKVFIECNNRKCLFALTGTNVRITDITELADTNDYDAECFVTEIINILNKGVLEKWSKLEPSHQHEIIANLEKSISEVVLWSN